MTLLFVSSTSVACRRIGASSALGPASALRCSATTSNTVTSLAVAYAKWRWVSAVTSRESRTDIAIAQGDVDGRRRRIDLKKNLHLQRRGVCDLRTTQLAL